MLLKDTKLGDAVIVYLDAGGELCQHGSNTTQKVFALQATIVGTCYHSLTGVSDVMLGFADTVSFVPNKTSRDVAPHNTPGYTFLKDFNKQYRWTVWAKSNMECVVGGKVVSLTVRQYPNDQCKCGIHLTLNTCEYHS